jgi:hypothetical protein
LFFSEFLDLKKGEGSQTPPIHQLTQNFRTHSGICDLASSLVELMMYFFPDSIDKLQKETGISYKIEILQHNLFFSAQLKGKNPVFLKTNFEEMHAHVTGGTTHAHIQLGAEQVCN